MKNKKPVPATVLVYFLVNSISDYCRGRPHQIANEGNSHHNAIKSSLR